MLSFLPVALLGYFLNSTAILISKFVVDKSVPNPIVYTFYVGIAGFLVLLLVPFGFHLPTAAALTYSLFSALAFVVALLLFYHSLLCDEPSVVAPIVGTFNPIFTFLISFFLFQQALTPLQILSVSILIFGLVVLSSTHLIQTNLERKHLLMMVSAGLFYALSAVLIKQTFLKTNFLTGLILVYGLTGVLVLGFLLIPKFRHQIVNSKVSKHHLINKVSQLLFLGEALGAGGGFLITYSYTLSSPAVINSLQGVQYVFILVVALLLPHRLQHLLAEDSLYKHLGQKILGSVIILSGLGLLAFS